MKRTTAKDYKEFKNSFIKYQNLLGLTGVKVYFIREPLKDCYANIGVDTKTCVATVKYSSVLGDEAAKDKCPSRTGKHEAIHLLTDRLENCAYKRFINEDEIKTAVEDIANRLERII
jgi:hypothetical protein